MNTKKLGRQTIRFSSPPSIISSAAVVGKKEGEGPLGHCFDYISEDYYFGEKTWEKAESHMLKQCFSIACDKANLAPQAIDYIFGGDLLNQCTASTFAMRDSDVPFFGLFSACSTMTEALSLAAMSIDGGFSDKVACLSSSHFCTAERQFRTPLEYGGQRAPTTQWTVTGAGAVILASSGDGPYITHITTGKIVDAGITDANNLGAAMSPAAYETIKTHFEDTGRTPRDYDLIITGDLGYLGREALIEIFAQDGIKLASNLTDCGLLIFDRDNQDVHSGGSGAGCCSSVFAGMLINSMRQKRWKRILFAATGALMSPTSTMQGESIPCISHAVAIELEV